MTSTVDALDTTTGLALDPGAQDLLFREARTANAYTDEPIDDDALRAVFDLVRWGPTSMNVQPLRILLLRSDDARARLVPHMAGANRDKVTSAPVAMVLAADHGFVDLMPTLFPVMPEEAARAYYADDGLRAHTADYNAAIQVAYLILGFRAAGLAAGPMAGFDRDGVDAEFFPDGAMRTSLVMTAGVPDPSGTFGRLPRLEFDDVVTSL
jgi:3-hydroxypropanoate dehydrogenase